MLIGKSVVLPSHKLFSALLQAPSEGENRVVDTGVGTSFFGNRKIGTGRFLETGVRVSRRDLELNDKAKF